MHSAPTRRARRQALVLALAALAGAVLAVSASANIPLQMIAVDPFTNPTSQHETIVEPDTYSFGQTIAAAAQWGRFYDGGASDIGVSVSTNDGTSWTAQQLPGMTVYSTPAGPWARVSDPSVAYDARHNVWMVSSLALDASVSGKAVILSRSTNGGATWNNPTNIAAAGAGQDFDKNWTACDNTPSSPYYGSCYTQWDDFGHGNALKVAYSRDGGLTWTSSKTPNVGVIGGQPLTLPNGNVVIPIDNASETALGYTISTNGGVKFGQAFTITSITAANDPGNIRSGPLPSADVASDGTIFVVWEDCRFRAGCYTNDLVYVTSTNGTTWSNVHRIPADPGGVTGTQDTFIPGIKITIPIPIGKKHKLVITFELVRNVSCTEATCELRVGTISSDDDGATWSPQTEVAGPMMMSWLPDTTQGRMVGDYISTSFNSQGLAYAAFPVANAPTSNDCATATPNCDQALYTFATGQAAGAGSLTANDPVVYTAKPRPGAAAFHAR
jgi:hypothetical protein